MFDRLRNGPKSKAAQLDRKQLEAWQNSRSSTSNARGVKGGDSQYQYSIRGGPGGPPPPRPQRDTNNPNERQQNRQSYQAPPSAHAPNSYRNSTYGRPVSSIYSQPSPDAATFAAQQLRGEGVHSDPNEISPPSSPDALSPRDEPNSGDVSPIEEIPDMSQLALDPRAPPKGETRSNIPMMRRERRKNSDAAMNALRDTKSRERLRQQRPYGHDVRWDPRTGEPTTDSAKGRPSQVNPQEYAQGLGIRQDDTSPPQHRQVQQTPFGERIRRVRQTSASPQPEPAPRPEWRGASGRTAIVPPVADKTNVAPLKVPPKSTKRAVREPKVLSPVNSVGSDSVKSPPAASPGANSKGLGNRGLPTQLGRQAQPPDIAVSKAKVNPQTYPSPPLSDDNTVPTPSPVQRDPPAQPQQSLQIPPGDKSVRRKPAGATGHNVQNSTSSSVYSQQDAHPAQKTPEPSNDGWTQPPSRFSVTTYATSHQSSTPRESLDVDGNAPPVPTPPQQFASQQPPKAATGSSMLDRKRPMVAGYDSVPPSRKSSPAEPVKISLDSPYYAPAPAPAQAQAQKNKKSSSSADKTLPPAPPESQSQTQDRVAQLNARLQALGNRRINLNTAIRQMTELMPTDNILASEAVVRKREAEKRKVEILRAELADVDRESYELGLKLHRAYKRMDRDAEYEPTTLWVRRVTGA
ncbi:hypothetical protein GGR52DRAFT_359226 [Hypoxylon sp. FL1284]|nr:hypothetical protein GGR52DRAFT_359226 [Hypoxylon sp. FL1284]